MRNEKPMWTCPKCQRPFANVNQWHSCGPYTVEDFLKDKPAEVVTLFKEFAKALESVGPFRYAPAKTRIGFQVRMIFAAINRTGRDFIAGHVILPGKHQSPKFYKIDFDCVHHFKIKNCEEIDEEFISYLRKAYRVGEQEYITRR